MPAAGFTAAGHEIANLAGARRPFTLAIPCSLSI
jgi:hypothetical protein